MLKDQGDFINGRDVGKMRNNRIWIIPTTIILLLVAAWSFRWGDGGKQGNKTYYIDRWLGQTWVKEVTEGGYAEYPIITSNLDLETQKAIDASPDLSDQMKKLEENIKIQDEIVVQNRSYISQYNSLASVREKEWHASHPNSWHFLTMPEDEKQYINSHIQSDIIDGYNTWATANVESVRLNKERNNIWNSVQGLIKQKHMDGAIMNRRIASIGSVTIGLIALISLVSLFVLDKKKTMKSETSV